MIVICEECGKKYRIDPSKIKGSAASFKCRMCSHVIVVSKPEPQPAPKSSEMPPRPHVVSADIDNAIADRVENKTDLPDFGIDAKDSETVESPARAKRKSRGMGLRSKMFFLFLVIPVILMAGAAGFFIWQMDQTVSKLTSVSTDFVNKMAEDKIADLSAAVAMQCRLYLMSNPRLKKENFSSDMAFKTLAVQKVGLTGYTALYEIPGSDGVWRTWAHVQPQIIGIDMSSLKKTLKENFDGFWKIYIGVKGGQKSQGYYRWKDKDGQFRDKFMVCTPVAGTSFVIAATTYLDEFTRPIQDMKDQTKVLTEKARMITLAILGGTILLIAIIVFVYAHRLTRKIRSLTDVAERISIGDMAIEIDTKSRDEIGDLAEAIDRMQDSIRLSIERLRRRR